MNENLIEYIDYFPRIKNVTKRIRRNVLRINNNLIKETTDEMLKILDRKICKYEAVSLHHCFYNCPEYYKYYLS